MLTLQHTRLVTRLPQLARSGRAFSCSPLAAAPVALKSEHFAPPQPATAGPLVVLHGLYGSKQNWRGLAKAMATQLKREVTTLVSQRRTRRTGTERLPNKGRTGAGSHAERERLS